MYNKKDILIICGFFGPGPVFAVLAFLVKNTVLKWIFGGTACLFIALNVSLIAFVIVTSFIEQQKEKRKPKSIFRYKILEPYPIDIEKTNQAYAAAPHEKGGSEREYCEIIAENDEYRFYTYQTYSDGSGGYILRQEKNPSAEVVYFGEKKKYNCLFGGYLFQVDKTGEVRWFGITARNVKTGELIKCDWLSHEWRLINFNGFGRFYSADIVEDVVKDGDKLIFKVTRLNTKRDYDSLYGDDEDIVAKYTLVVECIFGEFKVTRIIEKQ